MARYEKLVCPCGKAPFGPVPNVSQMMEPGLHCPHVAIVAISSRSPTIAPVFADNVAYLAMNTLQKHGNTDGSGV
jgi:hypothetical protein